MKLFKWLKHAKQRIKKGYSYQDLWSIYDWFFTLIPQMLEEFADEEYIGIPSFLVLKAEEEHPEMTEEEKYEWGLGQWRILCKEIAHHLKEGYEPKEQINEYEEEMFKNWSFEDINKEDDNPELTEKYRKRELEIFNYQESELKQGMEMLTKYLRDLWW